jgi:CheY-like chemotaxis protein
VALDAIQGEATMAVVLIADDDLDIRETLALFLGMEGHQVRMAADGQEMLDLLRSSPAPLVVLADQFMPHVSARYLVEALYAAPPELTRHAFVFVTGAPHALPPMPVEACPATFFAVVPKPFDLDELGEMLARANTHLDESSALLARANTHLDGSMLPDG